MARWEIPGIPHKGWECVEVFDLADESDSDEEIQYEQCEMCGNEKIRYVHVMKHREYQDELHVGCVCAEKMTGDYVTPRKIETSLRNRAARKTNFHKVPWKYNDVKHTYSKKYKGEYITILESRYGNFGVFFAGQRIWDIEGKKIRTFERAEHAAFEIFEEYHTTKEEREARYYIEHSFRY